jgi:hypothetical protein
MRGGMARRGRAGHARHQHLLAVRLAAYAHTGTIPVHSHHESTVPRFKFIRTRFRSYALADVMSSVPPSTGTYDMSYPAFNATS